MASLLQNMLQPATPIQAQAPQSPQTPVAPHPQDSNIAPQIIQGVLQAAGIVAKFL